MDKLKFYSDDIFKDKLQRLAEIFPECVTESGDNGNAKKSFNFELLKEILAENISDDPERYNFIWAGKSCARDIAGKKTFKTLRPCRAESVNWDDTQNLYIEGENLDVLKILRSSYSGKVKLIYIDPPYNTGNDFIYRDKFKMDAEDYDDATKLRDDDENFNFKKNLDSNPLIHSDWCSMIFPRLLLARELLADDGVIFISIDDNEQANLKKICDEVFGERNFVATFPYRKRTAKSDVPFGISQDYEWIACYSKTELFWASIAKDTRTYYTTNDFPNRAWRYHDLTTQKLASARPNSNFTIVNPKNGDEYPVNPNRLWAITKETFQEYYDADRIIFPGDYDFLNISKPVLRYWKEDDMAKAGEKFGKISVSTKFPDNVGMSQDGTKEITNILGGKIFSFPKPVALIKFLVNIATDTESIVLDFFSGSATTAHAVMALNAEDGGRRKFIMVQIAEPCAEDTEAYKAGYKNICEIGKERIRRAGSKIKAEMPLTTADIGFRVLKLDTSNFKDAYLAPEETTQDILKGLEDIIKEDRTAEDLLFSSLIACGLELTKTYEVEEYEGAKLIDYGGGEMLAYFDREISMSVIKHMAEKKPRRAVIRDDAFQRDADKINTDGIFKQISPSTKVKII